jgi:hypothetical protein
MTDQEKQIAEKLSLIWWPDHDTTSSFMKIWGIAKFKEVAQAAIEEIDKAVEKEREQSHLFAEWIGDNGYTRTKTYTSNYQKIWIDKNGQSIYSTAELRIIFNELKEGK